MKDSVSRRSTDSKNWVEIGSRLARGESNTTIKYSFTDNEPTQGTNLYRLKMIDLDGTFAYSRISQCELYRRPDHQFLPQPVSEKLHIKTDKWSDVQRIEIYSQNGKTVYKSARRTSRRNRCKTTFYLAFTQ